MRRESAVSRNRFAAVRRGRWALAPLALCAALLLLAGASAPRRASGQGVGHVKYSPGALDISFGEGGRVVTQFDDLYGSSARDVLVLPGGKILAVDTRTIPDAPLAQHHVALARYNADGTLDGSFGPGGDGIVSTGFGEGSDRAEAVALQPDGRVILAGYAGNTQGEVFDGQFALARYRNDRCASSEKGVATAEWTAHLSGVESGPAAEGANPQGQAVFHLERGGRELRYRLNLANVEGMTGASISGGATDDSGGGGRGGGFDVSLYDSSTCEVRRNGVGCRGSISDSALIRNLKHLVESGRARLNVTTRQPGVSLNGLLAPVVKADCQ